MSRGGPTGDLFEEKRKRKGKKNIQETKAMKSKDKHVAYNSKT